MSTSKSKKTKTPKSPEIQNPDATAPAETQQPEASAKPSRNKGEISRRVVSVSFPSRTARQLKLLSSISGEPIASIVVGAVTRVIAKRLPDALAEIGKADEASDGE